MLELAGSRMAVVQCLAPAAVLDGLGDALRVAPDEALLVGKPSGLESLMDRAETAATGGGVVLDASDGWAAWTLEGDAAREAFARVSELELPVSGFVQGEVAHVPAKVVTEGNRIDILVPAMWESHLRQRLLSDAADLGLSERRATSATANSGAR